VRLALVTTDFPPMQGGISALMSGLAQVLGQKCRVTVLAPAAPEAEAFDRGQPYAVVRAAGPPPFREATFLRALTRLERAERLDAVVCAFWFTPGLVAYLTWRRRGIPYVVWAYGSDILDDWRTPRRAVKSILRPLKRVILGRASAIVAISHYTRQVVADQGVPATRIHVICPGVDPSRFSPAPPRPEQLLRYRRGANRCLLTVARLDPHKGHGLVLRALAGPLRDIPALRYLIAGSGPEESALRRTAASLGVEDQVVFLGHVPDGELPDLYRAADVFVMPSGSVDRADLVEGFGIAYLEASASGKPVVGGRTGGTENAVVDGVTGFLVDPKDPAALARALRAVLEDPSLAERMGRAGRERVLTSLSLERMGERLLTLLESELVPR